MASLVSLPYYASDIPCSLPTDTEIDNAQDITLECGARRFVRVGKQFVNLLFVQENTKIPVPRVYVLYTSPETARNYIVMEQVHGETLQSLWPRLTSPEKDSIISTMRAYFDELMSLPSQGYYVSLSGRSLLDEIPLNPRNALNDAFALKYLYNGRSRFRADFYRQCLPSSFRDHQPTFTHGDFQRKNIIVQRAKDEAGEKSGWYSSYWEYFLAVYALRWDDDWCLWVEKTLDPFVSEAAWLQTLHLELWS
ncbi:phosphotransferase enzyme family protein [Aspergillus filifer]